MDKGLYLVLSNSSSLLTQALPLMKLIKVANSCANAEAQSRRVLAGTESWPVALFASKDLRTDLRRVFVVNWSYSVHILVIEGDPATSFLQQVHLENNHFPPPKD